MDKDAYYFSHDSNARHDPKIVKMLTKYKYGYQWYFMIVEVLREQADYKYNLDEYYGNAIARELHEDGTTVVSFIADCINEFKLFASDGKKFWSDSLLRRMKIKDQKSKIYRENAKKRWKDKQCNSNAIAMQRQCIKVKESKVKENNIPSLQEVKDYFLAKGYSPEIAEKAFNYYDANNWKDSKGKPVKSWKQKMIGVWFKDENKIKPKDNVIYLPEH